ncbi:uncharacterized protein PITG_02142 [Phytophthora infestans T30-4]|uniref:Uncharacterized protein n=1 Tax=Phytophthora infestans (strain T30-4) TaxID=403677 RepID=D0MVL1_PHYIT|nr:uncharacterized protein PITG_02142 [Phytophthora infestans T30-4]EEY63674.1 conserved hypothetical protein [Phytophthora infestans T30-4]|eukprot:XP_002907110.1 conserved hypothetical protein [Phytophthora infestans T30-4]
MTARIFSEWAEDYTKAEKAIIDDIVKIDLDAKLHEPIDVDCSNRSLGEDDSGNQEDDPPVPASAALAYCVELSTFLFQCEGDTKDQQSMLQSLTEVVRTQVMKQVLSNYQNRGSVDEPKSSSKLG